VEERHAPRSTEDLKKASKAQKKKHDSGSKTTVPGERQWEDKGPQIHQGRAILGKRSCRASFVVSSLREVKRKRRLQRGDSSHYKCRKEGLKSVTRPWGGKKRRKKRPSRSHNSSGKHTKGTQCRKKKKKKARASEGERKKNRGRNLDRTWTASTVSRSRDSATIKKKKKKESQASRRWGEVRSTPGRGPSPLGPEGGRL